MSVLGTHLRQCTNWCFCERLCLASVNFFLKILNVFVYFMMGDMNAPGHSALCSTVFDQKWHGHHASPSLFIRFHPKQHFFCLFPWTKKSSKWNSLLVWKRGNEKWQKHYKASKLTSSKTVLNPKLKKSLDRCIASNRVLWRWLKFKHIRINTQLFINKFCFLGGPPFYVKCNSSPVNSETLSCKKWLWTKACA